MRWKTSLSPVTIKGAGFEESFEIAHLAGFDGITIRYDRLCDYLDDGHTIRDVARLLDKYHLLATEIGFLAEWQFHGGIPLVSRRKRTGSEDPAALEAEARRFFQCAVDLRVGYATAVPAVQESGDLADAVKDFQHLCDLANDYGVTLGFEFVGSATQMKDIRIAWQIIQMAAKDNGRILLDTFLFYQGGSKLADLAQVPVDQIVSVHICDAANVPIGDLDMLKHRVYPGEGVIPLTNILGDLMARGFDGYYTLELFNEDYWADDPLSVAQRGREAIEDVLSRTASLL